VRFMMRGLNGMECRTANCRNFGAKLT